MSPKQSFDVSKINIGCGSVAADGWLNIDKSPNAWLAKHRTIRSLLIALKVAPKSTQEAQYRSDIELLDIHKKPLPVADGSVEWIYTSHLIGSMNRAQALKLMKECSRVLRPGGRLRIVTPDLEKVAQDWLNKIQAYFQQDRAYFTDCTDQNVAIGDCFVESMNLKLFTGTSMNKIQKAFHYPVQYIYDFDSLELLLHQAGFGRVEKSDYRQSAMPDVEQLDVRPGSLYVEAIK
ncbi:MAG: methyltransferase domain-containing protein [Caldilineaceae bacterium]|nr:methyltransferase domain-containing protein [Caldilineaceae bacterium]